MSSHETRSWSVWCQGEDIEKVSKDQGIIEIETLLCQVTRGVITLAQQVKGLRRQKLEK